MDCWHAEVYADRSVSGEKRVGQKKPREKTADDLQTERVTAALEETDRTGRAPALVRENPGQFLRDMYEVWHRQGGKEGGRWRNSIRKMRDEWLTGRNAVPSLHPKLMGRVKVTRSDARALIGLFLERWRYGEGSDALSSMTGDGYVEFSANDAKKLRSKMLNGLFLSHDVKFLLEASSAHNTKRDRPHRRELELESFIENDYRHSDALITFSRNRIAVGPNPPQIMKNFFHLFNKLYEEESQRDSSCVFIWIVDLGLRLFEDDESFYSFYNAGLLSLLLHSLSTFESERDGERSEHGPLFRRFRIIESPERMRRWRWLMERSIVVVDNLLPEEIHILEKNYDNIDLIDLRDAEIKQHHILPSEIPSAWSSLLGRSAGHKIGVNNISFTSLINKKGWPSDGRNKKKAKYYAHFRTVSDIHEGSSNVVIRSIEMPSPGSSYDEAFWLVYLAAQYRLQQNVSLDSEEATAFAYLRRLGYHTLRLEEFARVFHPK